VALALTGAAVVVAALRWVTAPAPLAPVSFQPTKPAAATWTPAGFAIDSCLSAIRDARRVTAIPGWPPTLYRCAAGQSLTIDIVRSGYGQIGLIRALLPEARLGDDGRSAVLAIPLPAQPRLSAAGPFATGERYRTIGLDLAQRLNGSFTLQPARRALPGEADTTPPNQSWTALSWSYRTQAPAIVWAGALARLGSIAVDTLTFSPADNLWQISGSLYAHN
jgi:hypothetical protein